MLFSSTDSRCVDNKGLKNEDTRVALILFDRDDVISHGCLDV